MMDKKPKFRHELKYEINRFDRIALGQRLRAVMRRDPHAGPDGTYLITSLYFDTADDKALREKMNGVNHREKFRIRYYNEDDSRIRLEKKEKHNGLCLKRSAELTREQCQKLLAANSEWMGEKPAPLLQELDRKMRCDGLRPKTLVTYRREPFIYEPGNVRVTFDSDIRTGLWSTELLDPGRPAIPVTDPARMILEVKYDEFLPEIIADMLQMGRVRVRAFSKYAGCRVYE